ncbi:unc-89, partial [Symbiodinium pilosum]
LAVATRVCIFDPVGLGWSERGPPAGFQVDAEAMKSVVDAELATHGAQNWQVVVGGHSRGHLTACTFMRQYGQLYEGGVAVLGFDGSFCGPPDDGTREILELDIFPVLRWSLAPVLSLVAGFARILLVLLLDHLLHGWPVVHFEEPITDLPPRVLARVAETYLRPNLWRTSSQQADNWVQAYDGPDDRLGPSWKRPSSPEHLDIRRNEVCIGKGGRDRVCATHDTIIMQRRFAALASDKALAFLRQLSGQT